MPNACLAIASNWFNYMATFLLSGRVMHGSEQSWLSVETVFCMAQKAFGLYHTAGCLLEQKNITCRGAALPLLPASQPSAIGASPSPWHQPAKQFRRALAAANGSLQRLPTSSSICLVEKKHVSLYAEPQLLDPRTLALDLAHRTALKSSGCSPSGMSGSVTSSSRLESALGLPPHSRRHTTRSRRSCSAAAAASSAFRRGLRTCDDSQVHNSSSKLDSSMPATRGCLAPYRV